MEKKQRTNFTPPPLTKDNPSRSFYEFNSGSQPLHSFPPSSPFLGTQSMDWDPRTVLTNLSFLEQKIHQIQDIVQKMISTNEGQHGNFPLHATQQQMLTTDLTSIVIQLISAAGSLLPSNKASILSNNPPIPQLSSFIGSSSNSDPNPVPYQSNPSPDYEELIKWEIKRDENVNPVPIEDLDVKDGEDVGLDGDNLPIGSYEVLQLEKEEILAPHTHFCAICGKGFKRDANLRMHMRGHGDEYKTHAALSKPIKEIGSEPIKRYSCPFMGCKRNKEHKNFQPLKTILCVKNHYKRSHCEKSYICSRCNTKRFSVIADLKTHEKHCGRDKWLCSCGTTFSRKDKLFGHVALFQGHTPALPSEEIKGKHIEEMKVQNASDASFACGSNGDEFLELKGGDEEFLELKGGDEEFLELKEGYFSPMNFDSFGFDPPESSFSFGKYSDS